MVLLLLLFYFSTLLRLYLLSVDWRFIHTCATADHLRRPTFQLKTTPHPSTRLPVYQPASWQTLPRSPLPCQRVKGTENEAEDFDGAAHQRLLQKLPLKPTQCRLGMIATASGESVAAAPVAGDEADFWTRAAQVTIATLEASLTCVMWSALRQARSFSTAAPVRTVERGIQSEHNPVDVIPTNVCCSLGGECCRTSRRCEGLQNAPMNALRRRRSCACCIQRDGR